MAQTDVSILVQLLAQAAGATGPASLERSGVGSGADPGAADPGVWRAIVEEAGTLGAKRALARLGLEDAHAASDMAELRNLLKAWREAKNSLWKAVLGWVAKTALVLLLAGVAVELRLWEVLK